MYQLGNLVLVCSQRTGVLFQMINGDVAVYVGSGPDRVVLTTKWHDDEKIREIIMELNFGKYKDEGG